MPGDLRDPESLFPFYYESTYEPGRNPFEPGSSNFDGYLRSIAEEGLGKRPSGDTLDRVKMMLDQKGFLGRNPGDQQFREEALKCFKMLETAGKVASRWLI